MKGEEGLEEKVKILDFDPDLSPSDSHNVCAAEQRGLRYDPHTEMYKDEDGCLITDKYGQHL